MSSLDISIGSPSMGDNEPLENETDSDSTSGGKNSFSKRNREHDQSLVVDITQEELKYRETQFPFDDYKDLKKKGLKCTTCGDKILIQSGEEILSHVYLKVAVCKKCKEFYGKGDFSLDEDGTDKFCRWCGNGGNMFCCSTCTCVFCKVCVKRNLGRNAAIAIAGQQTWDCYICDIKPLWSVRGLCWGAQQCVASLNREKKQKVNATLIELKAKKESPIARRKLDRRKNYTKPPRLSRKLFTGSDDDNMKGQKSRRKNRMLKPDSDSDGVDGEVILSSESESETENSKVQGARKRFRRLSNKSSGLTDPDKIGRKERVKRKSDEPVLNGGKSKENNTRTRKKYESTSSGSDGDVGGVNSLTSKTDSRPTSSVSAMSNESKVARRGVAAQSKHTESTESVDKLAFFDSQTRSSNTGKRKKKNRHTSADDEEKEMDNMPTAELTGSGHTSGSDSVNNSDSEDNCSGTKGSTTKRSPLHLSKKATLSGNDEPRLESSNGNSRQRRTITQKNQNQSANASNEEDNVNDSHVSAVINSNSDHSTGSVGSRATEILKTSMNSKVISKSGVNTKDTDFQEVKLTNSASINARRSSGVVPNSLTKMSVSKRSSSTGDVRVVDEDLSYTPKKAVNAADNATNDFEDSDSGEEMPLKVDKESSENIMQYMQQQCYVSHALGKSLCRVTKIIQSKIKGTTDFENARNIDKIFTRMIRMSKSVRRNAQNLQTAFAGKYKTWKRDVRSGNRECGSEVASLDVSVKKVQAKLAAWEEEYEQWQQQCGSTDDEAVESKETIPASGSKLRLVSKKKKEKQAASSDLDNLPNDDLEDESPSLLEPVLEAMEINETGSISSNLTQPYDHKKITSSLKDVEEERRTSKSESAGHSDDLFSEVETEVDKSPQSLEKKKSKKPKSDRSKSARFVISQSSEESNDEANQAASELARSSDTEDFPVSAALPRASRENSMSPTPVLVNKAKSKSVKSPACPKSKRKTKPADVSDEDPPVNSARKEEVDESSPERVMNGKTEEDTRAESSSSKELSPDKAKALLLASSSDDEPLQKLAQKSQTSSKRNLRAKPGSKNSSDEDEDGAFSDKAKSKRREAVESSTKKKLRTKPGSKNLSDGDEDGAFSDDEAKPKKRSQAKRSAKKKLSLKSQSKLDRRLLRSFNDEKLEQTVVVELRRLELEELSKYGIHEIPKSKKSKKQNASDSDDESSAVARLINLKTATKRNRSKRGSGSSSGSADDLKRLKKKKPAAKESKKTKSAETENPHSGSEEAEDAADELDVSNAVDKELTEQELSEMNNRLVKEQLLASSSDEDADDPPSKENPKKKTPKKDAKEKAENGEKTKSKKSKKGGSDDDEEGKNASGSDCSDIIPKKKRDRRGKLFRMNLSMSDSSDEERKFKKKEALLKEKKDNEPEISSNSDSEGDAMLLPKSSGKKKRNKIKSDSDASVQPVESSSSSNSDDDFVIPSKHKRKGKSSDSDSSAQKKKKAKRRRIKMPKSDSDSDVEEVDPSQNSTPGKGRKNIRKVMTEESVGEQTKRAAREEAERKKRIEEKQQLYNQIYGAESSPGVKVVTEKLVLDFDPETKEELVKVHDSIVKKLKPHQVRGVEFMWNVCYESVKQLEKNKGAGCILAHCMGLGKSFQVVTLVHTLLTNSLTQVKTVLVVCPLSTALNWVNEFRIWLKDMRDEDEVDVFELSKYKKPVERMHKLEEWHRNGGVMVMNYELYRTLSMNNVKKLKAHIKKSWQKTLVDPGPDLVVCDEGHLLKNEDSAVSKAMRKVKTLRRIVLTGTPLQNNLVEYHCMVNFVRPNLLGTRKEFLNRFVNPITNGQYEDSTAHDVKIMKRRAHVLHKMLDGIVQRYDYAELMPFLPEKQEYVISVRLSESQAKIYQHFLEHFSGLAMIQSGVKNTRLLPDWHVFQRINTHPKVLLYHDEGVAEKGLENSDESEGSLKDFIDDDNETSSEFSSGSGSDSKPSKPAPKRRLRGDPEPEPEVIDLPAETASSEEWWREYCTDDIINGINSSGKLALLFSMLKECEKIGDKLLVFSQSLSSLRLIEEFLERIDRDTRRVQREAKNNDAEPESDPLLGGHTGFWVKGFDYFRLDGSVTAENRNKDCKIFNNKNNHRGRLYLISTRAGGLGINLVAANRVVVFDASWNPSHDVQSIFRVFRFGQVKPCYIYRFLAYSTIEERVYERQVTKLSLSCRVVDEQQIDRHYTNKDIMAMYTFDHARKEDRPTPILPKDRMLAELLKEHGEWIETYHEHDSLLENKADEELNEEERKAAWDEYEQEKKPPVNTDHYMFMLKNNPEALRNLLRSQNPEASEEEIEQSMLKVRQLAAIHEQRLALAQQQRIQQFQQQQQQFQQQQFQQQFQQQQQQQFGMLRNFQNQQRFPSGIGANYPTMSPGMNANALQQALTTARNAMPNVLQTNRHLVKVNAPAVPRISVRSMADMQKPSSSTANAKPQLINPASTANAKPQLINPFSIGMRSMLTPALPGVKPPVSITPVKSKSEGPKLPKKSGAPLSPINLD